ncbi:hypothetical protein QR680_005136 [Steinernema hermaphroditum]|uniref:RING-type domain-containing protein n=1 Tax=Steinernema hermaphroditum TaxID=289476 RepID=A0AA39LV45_9BILA|nr:hypothetical protein QR680_005136 [Steinernema hermaphroditum]
MAPSTRRFARPGSTALTNRKRRAGSVASVRNVPMKDTVVARRGRGRPRKNARPVTPKPAPVATRSQRVALREARSENPAANEHPAKKADESHLEEVRVSDHELKLEKANARMKKQVAKMREQIRELEHTIKESVKKSADLERRVVTAELNEQRIMETCQLLQEVNESSERTECIICFDHEREVAYVPCGHMGVCEHCSLRVHTCPVCLMKINGGTDDSRSVAGIHFAVVMEDNLTSLTVAIELDNDEEGDECDDSDGFSGPSTSGFKGLIEICSPPSASSLVPHVSSEIKVKHLKSDAKLLLQLRLDPHPLGSMRNWEFIANQLGLDNDHIINLQRRESPMEHLLSMFSDYPLTHLLSSIADSNRIDLLISLKPHLHGIQPPSEAHAPHDSGLMYSTTSSIRPKLVDFSEPFVVVTHCTPKKSAERKSFRWFLGNLKAAAVGAGVAIVDIDDFLGQDKELSDLELLFRKARHIIVLCSVLYRQLMERNDGETDHFEQMKVYFHKKLLDAEYMELGRNERFRPVTITGASQGVLLNGWQKNTIVYEFPTHFNDLLVRIFGPKRASQE